MLKKTDSIILTAGPTISEKEVQYVTDAVIHGWNHHHSDYIKRFEETFARYIGVKYAMATSSCTGALHLALLAMGVGAGDEVIVPETTWIATVSAVEYVGAKPVFADIDPDTWVMDPNSVARLITEKTKVIIPVHLYGNPVEMEPLWDLAEKHGIDILEDAAPSIGAEYKGRKTGSLGRAAAFSFQGAKALVTGEGGMLVSNDKDLMDRARLIGDHGRDPNRAFWNFRIGHKYKMSNVQAALGLAQIERVEEIVAKKRQIFQWYQERLQDVPDFRLNVEKPWARSLYWMSSAVLGDSYSISREEFMKQLKERNIDTRPFFYPISSFPMYKHLKVNNPVAYSVPLRAINLPSGHERTEEEIDYICAHIKDILGMKLTGVHSIQPQGWLDYRDRVNQIIREYKIDGVDRALLIENNGENIGKLRPVTLNSLGNSHQIEQLAKWRRNAQQWFPTQFPVTYEGTKRWLDKALLQTADRILFMVEDQNGKEVGHVGLFRFDYINRACEIDNIIRGENKVFSGAMTFACTTLLKWARDVLGIEHVYLRVFSDNTKALNLYQRLGFKEIQRTPLTKVQEDTVTRWIDVIGRPYQEVERYFVTMKLEHVTRG